MKLFPSWYLRKTVVQRGHLSTVLLCVLSLFFAKVLEDGLKRNIISKKDCVVVFQRTRWAWCLILASVLFSYCDQRFCHRTVLTDLRPGLQVCSNFIWNCPLFFLDFSLFEICFGSFYVRLFVFCTAVLACHWDISFEWTWWSVSESWVWNHYYCRSSLSFYPSCESVLLKPVCDIFQNLCVESVACVAW